MQRFVRYLALGIVYVVIFVVITLIVESDLAAITCPQNTRECGAYDSSNVFNWFIAALIGICVPILIGVTRSWLGSRIKDEPELAITEPLPEIELIMPERPGLGHINTYR